MYAVGIHSYHTDIRVQLWSPIYIHMHVFPPLPPSPPPTFTHPPVHTTHYIITPTALLCKLNQVPGYDYITCFSQAASGILCTNEY